MEVFDGMNLFVLLAPLIIVQLILAIVALTDLFKRKQTVGPKWMWVFIIVFVATFGPIIYFIVGRERH